MTGDVQQFSAVVFGNASTAP